MFDTLENFVYSCIISGDYTGDCMDVSEAAINISEYREDFPELFAGVTPEAFADLWNETVAQLHAKPHAKIVARYALLMRPPMPGAMPREGLMECREISGTTPGGHHAWGWAEYNRRLTEKEISDYELEYISSYESD